MHYVEKTHTWKDNWNDIIRYVLFQDMRLRELMMIPDNCRVSQFIEKYFIELHSSSEILTDEKVRILYSDTTGPSTRNKNVFNYFKEFDIYVQEAVVHNVSNDKLQCRYDVIAQRLKYLLLNHCQEYGLTMHFEQGTPLWTKAQGYRRYHLTFSYKQTV